MLNSADSIKAVASALGYFGALAFFVPTALAAALDYRSSKFADFAKDKPELAGTVRENQSFSEKVKLKSQFANALGLVLITLAFYLGT
jgi:hypothetical protein